MEHAANHRAVGSTIAGLAVVGAASGVSDQALAEKIGSEVERIAYRGCAGSADVVLYKVVDGAHNWPGSFELDDLGLPTQDINAADLILDFFSQHPHPAKNARS